MGGQGTVAGTGQYMAPEVMMSNDDIENNNNNNNNKIYNSDDNDNDDDIKNKNSNELKSNKGSKDNNNIKSDDDFDLSIWTKTPYRHRDPRSHISRSNSIDKSIFGEKDYRKKSVSVDEILCRNIVKNVCVENINILGSDISKSRKYEEGDDIGEKGVVEGGENKVEGNVQVQGEVENEVEEDMKKQKRKGVRNKGYGRKSDIWSLGITLCEMSTGKPPFRTAAAAVYNVFVTKQYPKFSVEMSENAHNFLGRCLVPDPNLRGNCNELLAHAFLEPQVCTTPLKAPLVRSHTLSRISFTPFPDILNPDPSTQSPAGLGPRTLPPISESSKSELFSISQWFT